MSTFVIAWWLSGVATWIAGFYWWPGVISEIHRLVMNNPWQALNPVSSWKAWLIAIAGTFVFSVVAWPLLLVIVFTQDFDDE